MIENGKLAVIGDAESVTAFRAIGAKTFPADNSYQASDILRTLIKGGYAVVFITENLAKDMNDLLKKLKSRPFPAVIPIPGALGSDGFCMAGLKHDVEKAIGVDIIFNK